MLNTLPVFPFSLFYFMNGKGGRYQGIRVRSSTCRDVAPKRRELWGEPLLCVRFAGKLAKLHPDGALRPWELSSDPFTPDMAGRLVAHELGHGFGQVAPPPPSPPLHGECYM